MTWFSGTEQKTLTLRATRDEVVGFFCDPAVFKVALSEVVSTQEIESNVWKWTLKEKKEKGITFQGIYVVEYTPNENGVTWKTREGNMESEGEMVISGSDGAVVLQYNETVRIDLPVPKLIAKVIQGVVGREIRSGIQQFLDNGQKAVESK